MIKTFLLTFCLVGLVVTGCIEIYADETEIIEDTVPDNEDLFAAFSMSGGIKGDGNHYLFDGVYTSVGVSSSGLVKHFFDRSILSAESPVPALNTWVTGIPDTKLIDTWDARFVLTPEEMWQSLVCVNGKNWKIVKGHYFYLIDRNHRQKSGIQCVT